MLGDIVDSNPVWVGPPASPYPATWSDNLYPSGNASMPENGSGAQSYPTFATANVKRTNVVYAGADDGMLHGFRTGAYDGAISSGYPYGNYVETNNDGQELLAYLPATVLNSIHNASTASSDYSSPSYSHSFYVDATPGSGDLFYNNAWHTWLVGGLGPGGSAIYALDVTNPSNFSEANASSLVIGEVTSAANIAAAATASLTPATALPCVVSGCGAYLGNTYGTPVIRRMHNGGWAVLFGNGFPVSGATGTHAGIYIVTITASGLATAYYLDAGTDPQNLGRNNGIAYVTTVDLDGDHVIDYVYAGDLLGNIWRFDVTSSTASNWAVSQFGKGKATPLFTTVWSGTASVQPITTKLLVLSVPGQGAAGASANNRVLVVAGTGQEIPATITSDISYVAGTQAVYGIWDWDMAGWNSLNSAAPYAYLSQSSYSGTTTYSSTSGTPTLAAQTISAVTSGGTTYRTISGPAVCWQGSTTCGSAASSNYQFGWVANLPGTAEQVVYNPLEYNGAILINTTIPPQNSALSCTTQLPTGWTMAFQPEPTPPTAAVAATSTTAAVAATGGSFPNSVFANSSGVFAPISTSTTSGTENVVITGVQTNASGSGAIITNDGTPYLVNNTVTGGGGTGGSSGTTNNPLKMNLTGNATAKRVNWTELR